MRNNTSAVVSVTALSFLLTLSGGCKRSADALDEDDIELARAELLKEPPRPRYSVNADLGGKAVYLGLDVDPMPVRPGKAFRLTHYWKVVAPLGDQWKAFTHLEATGHQKFMNTDHAPVGGKYPVSAWRSGDIIRDVHAVQLPVGWNKPAVEVYVGLWQGKTRMQVNAGPHDAEGRVLAATIPLDPPNGAEPKRYVARLVTKAPRLDGKLDDAVWGEATSTGPFLGAMTGSAPGQRTEAKLAWDKKFLYVSFDSADTDVWTPRTKRDERLSGEDAVVVQIDADGDRRSFVELQVAPNGTVADAYLPEPGKYEDAVDAKKKPFSWNAQLKAKVKVAGTLNVRDDKDRGWTAELAIPLANLKGLDEQARIKLPPTPGDIWRINLLRSDATRSGLKETSGWSPPLIAEVALDRFGEVVFADAEGNTAPKKEPTLASVQPRKLKGKPLGELEPGAAPPAAAPLEATKGEVAKTEPAKFSEAKAVETKPAEAKPTEPSAPEPKPAGLKGAEKGAVKAAGEAKAE